MTRKNTQYGVEFEKLRIVGMLDHNLRCIGILVVPHFETTSPFFELE